jgi:hypothetical protein
MLPGLLDELRARRGLPDAERKFLVYTLNAGAVAEALAEGGDRSPAHQSSIDDLFARSRRFRRSKKFAEAVDFVAKVPRLFAVQQHAGVRAEPAGDAFRHRQPLAQGFRPLHQGGGARHDHPGAAHAGADGL